MDLTYEQAVSLAKSGWWKGLPSDTITAFQLYTDRLCLDFHDYHKAVEESLGRPVWTHEFASPDLLRAEFEGKRERPSMDEILDLLPQKALLIVVDPARGTEQ